MKTDICKCGKLKDYRSKQCIDCTHTERANLPCKGCGKCKPEIVLGKRKSLCIECQKKRSKKYREWYSERIKQGRKNYAETHRDSIRRRYTRRNWKLCGLDPDDIELRISNYNGGCEICGDIPTDDYKTLCVDHCHNTKTFRGFLCKRCNSGLGLFRDNPEFLIKASEYLKRGPSV